MILAFALSDFWKEGLRDALTGLISAAFAAILVYRFVEHKLQLTQQKAREREFAEHVLGLVTDELDRNRRIATALRTHLSSGVLPYGAFEVTGWDLLTQSATLNVLKPEITRGLIQTYGRLRAANEQHALLLDLTYGPTSALSFLVSQSAGRAEAGESRRRIEERRSDLRERLRRRIDDLDEPLKRVAAEVEVERNRLRGERREPQAEGYGPAETGPARAVSADRTPGPT